MSQQFTAMTTRVQALVGNHSLVTTTIASGFVNDQHRELLEQHEWARRKSEIILSTIPDKTAGTVTLTNGASTVAGSSTAWAATDEGKYILIGESLFVFGYVGATSGTLKDLYGSTVIFNGVTLADQSYVLFKRWYALGNGIESILSVKHTVPIRERNQEYLDSFDPTRFSVASVPLFYARGPYDQSAANDIVRIEFYPRPSASIDIVVSVQKGHTDLAGTQAPIVPANTVQWLAARDAALFLFAKTKEPKWIALADKYLGYTVGPEGSFEKDKMMDAKHFGRSPAVKDVMGGVGLAQTDFALAHDLEF